MYTSLKLKIVLLHTKPEIWRSVIVQDSLTFSHLHEVLQIVMGWSNAHLFEFDVNGTILRCIDERFEEEEEATLNASEIILHELLRDNTRFVYLYDFGDHWKHEVVVEKIIQSEFPQIYPHCTDGYHNCPPEDCGGVPGFYYLLKVLGDKDHNQYEYMSDFAGRYNPEKFDIKKINKKLARIKTATAV